MADRVIKWIHIWERTNPTAPLSAIQPSLNIVGRYKQLIFQQTTRLSEARMRIISSRENISGWMAARKPTFEIRMHPTVNWGMRWSTFGACILHEFLHLAGMGTHLTEILALMHPNAGIGKNFHPQDYNYMTAYPWRSSLRPEHEPTYRWDVLSPKNPTQFASQEEEQQVFASEVMESGIPACSSYENNSWMDWLFRPRPKIDITNLDLSVQGHNSILVP